jgi:hypothetical protein
MKKTVKYTLDLSNPLPLTKKQKAEIKALSEMPDNKINYCDIPSPLDAQFLRYRKVPESISFWPRLPSKTS